MGHTYSGHPVSLLRIGAVNVDVLSTAVTPEDMVREPHTSPPSTTLTRLWPPGSAPPCRSIALLQPLPAAPQKRQRFIGGTARHFAFLTLARFPSVPRALGVSSPSSS